MSLHNFIQNRKAASIFFEGREQISIADLMDAYPTGVEITNVYIGYGNNGEYIAFTTREEPGKFSFGGTVFMKIIKECASNMGGIDVVNDELKKEPLLIRFTRKINKFNKPYYDVE